MPIAPPAPAPSPRQPVIKPKRPNAPPPGFWDIVAVDESFEGPRRRLRGSVRIETTEMVLYADEVDYDEQTGDAEARGNVHFQHFEGGEDLRADRVEYNFNTEAGKFYNVKGSARARVEARQGVLATDNPFYFEGAWAEKIGRKYVLHDGMITNCKLPAPFWTLRGPAFDIIPSDHAIARRALFRVRGVPLLYIPYFYKSLERVPRRSGFLTPNIGNSNRRGKMIGLGYYWAINRSHDVSYRVQDFTQRGLAHHIDVRGKPRAGTDFNAIFYGVDDRGLKLPSGERIKQGGYSVYMQLQSDLGRGFYARGNINYLSSLTFRQAFTESFQEAIFSEAHSTVFAGKQWSTYSFNTAFARLDNFQSTQPGDTILIRKLPELSFSSRDRRIWKRGLPVWVSLESTAGLLQRTQPLFQTRQFVDRVDIQPRVRTALRWKDFHILPSFAVQGTRWGESQQRGADPAVPGRITGDNISRGSREVFVDIVPPSFQRTFRRKTLFGDQLKHVIEPRASFRHVAGVADFDRFIRFDATELVANTTEAEISVTNRFFAKRGVTVSEILTWTLWQRRYFDPDFGGAILEDRRNVVQSAVQLTPYAFLDRPRYYSPVVSALRMAPVPWMGIEWRSDYDPLRSKIVNSSFTADARWGEYFVSFGHSHVRSAPLLTPSANQLRSAIGFGNPNHRGWNAAFSSVWDFRLSLMQYAATQVTYNTDCCGFSIQYRRLGLGTRNENQFRVALAIANIGSFGTLKKQERLF